MTTTATPKSYDAETALEKMRAKKTVYCLPTEEACKIVEHLAEEHVEILIGKSLTRVPTVGFEKMYKRAAFADKAPDGASTPAA